MFSSALSHTRGSDLPRYASRKPSAAPWPNTPCPASVSVGLWLGPRNWAPNRHSRVPHEHLGDHYLQGTPLHGQELPRDSACIQECTNEWSRERLCHSVSGQKTSAPGPRAFWIRGYFSLDQSLHLLGKTIFILALVLDECSGPSR